MRRQTPSGAGPTQSDREWIPKARVSLRLPVTPAKAGGQCAPTRHFPQALWIPACAGMTERTAPFTSRLDFCMRTNDNRKRPFCPESFSHNDQKICNTSADPWRGAGNGEGIEGMRLFPNGAGRAFCNTDRGLSSGRAKGRSLG